MVLNLFVMVRSLCGFLLKLNSYTRISYAFRCYLVSGKYTRLSACCTPHAYRDNTYEAIRQQKSQSLGLARTWADENGQAARI